MKNSSIGIRVIISCAIMVMLLIPIFMIQSLISDRWEYRKEAVADINKTWSGAQLIGGPILTIKAEKLTKGDNGKNILTQRTYQLLPDDLNIETEMIPEKRYRGIYEVMVYQSKIKMTATILADRLKKILVQDNPEILNMSFISVSISDLKGINESVQLKINDSLYEVNPGPKNIDLFENGFHSPINLAELTKDLHIEIVFQLKGSETLQFFPFGKNTTVKVKSKWSNPSFIGEFLPDNRTITDSGFNAVWKVSHFNRQFPQDWVDTKYQFANTEFGVSLLLPVDEYQKTNRTSKYGILIILLTFVSFFFIEIFSKKMIHPIQYLLVGLALVIFYSLLLAFSEYIAFQGSYLISAILVIGLISMYVASTFGSWRHGVIISSILSLFYGFMFVILQLQDLSLMIGNIAIFLILAVIMFITRKINWFDLMGSKVSEGDQL